MPRWNAGAPTVRARPGRQSVLFASVSAGSRHTCGVRDDASVECWGSNEDWLGFYNNQARPADGSFASVSAGGLHTCGVRTDGSVACWGDDDFGQATPPGGPFASVSAGTWHTCGVRTDGSVECWGVNEDGGGNVVGQARLPPLAASL